MKGNNNIIKDKSFAFAIRVVNLYKYLRENKQESILSKQLLRSGTAIGAMVRESQNAESTPDFIHKLAIAQKECDESLYWLDLLQETQFISDSEHESIAGDALGLLKIIRSIILTAKGNAKLPHNS